MEDIIVLILAAGSSSRLGRPKQLERLNDKPLIRIAAETCLASGFTNVNTVLGYRHHRIKKEIEDLPVRVFFNKNWQRGLGSSLAYGLQAARKTSSDNANGLLIYLADQPFITTRHLQNLYEIFAWQGKKIVCSGYRNTFGPPLLCHRSLFEDLAQLGGNEGAKKIIKNYHDDMHTIAFEPAGIDIDDADDLKLLKERRLFLP